VPVDVAGHGAGFGHVLQTNLRVPLNRRNECRFVQWPEALAERDVLFGRQFLITEEQHLVPVPGIAECPKGLVVHRLCQIQAGNFGADGATHRFDSKFFSCHIPLLSCCISRPVPCATLKSGAGNN